MSVDNQESLSLALLKSLMALLVDKDVLTVKDIKTQIDQEVWLRRDDENQEAVKFLKECGASLESDFSHKE